MTLFFRVLSKAAGIVLSACLGWSTMAIAQSEEGKRLALVIGVSDYAGLSDLVNPVEDAKAVSEKLKSLRFNVTTLTDPKADDLGPALAQIADSGDAQTVLVYFSGHAFQLDGVNYLAPGDLAPTSAQQMAGEAWNLNAIIDGLNADGQQTLIFLDASRNTPWTKAIKDDLGNRVGLARVQTGRGTFVAFATEPNSVTFGGDEQPGSSPFTAALIDNMDASGISISDLMIRVRNQVQEATFQRQNPWEQSSLNAQFYFQRLEPLRSDRLGDADLELLASVPNDVRDGLLALLARERVAIDSKALTKTVEITAAATVEEAPKPGLCIPGITLCEDEPDETAQTEGAPVERIALLDPVDDKPTVGPSRVIGRTETVPAGTNIVQPAKPILRGGVYRTVAVSLRTADLLSRAQPGGTITGLTMDPESQQAQQIIAEAYGDLGGETEAQGETIVFIGRMEPKELATQVQTELARLGCYRMRIDGDWAGGSRAAAVRYYAARAIVPDNLDPSRALLRQLIAEDSVVCKYREVQSTKVAAAIEEVRSTPVRQQRTLQQGTAAEQRDTIGDILLRPGALR